jgi:hypothetical protein
MNPRVLKFGLRFGFGLRGTIFGADVVDLLWAQRDRGPLRSLTMNLGMLLFVTDVLFIVALRKLKSGS